MMDRFKNKYRIESNRLRGWDYSSNGIYFITIVTMGMEPVFGEIRSNKMILNEFGEIAVKEWYNSFEMRRELFLDEFILMPNHLHAIVVLHHDCINCRDARPCVSTDTITDTNTDPPTNTHANKWTNTSQTEGPFQRKPKSISSFVAGYKSAVINTIDDCIDKNRMNINKFNRNNPLWQSNYHDHIIRDDASYYKIKSYIIDNPKNWDVDRFNNDFKI